jgi:hypothetical protein
MQRRFHSADAHGPSCNAPRGGGESRFRKCLALADAALQRFAEFRNVHFSAIPAFNLGAIGWRYSITVDVLGIA